MTAVSPVSENKKVFGKHYILELVDCDPELLKSVSTVEGVMERAARESKATVLNTHYHQFEPHGVSGFVLIAESHFSIHTWPEHGYASVDIQTCGEIMDADLAAEIIVEGFRSKNHHCQVIKRGV